MSLLNFNKSLAFMINGALHCHPAIKAKLGTHSSVVQIRHR